jgi:hypothetical protein
MLCICVFWLLPLIALVVISALIYDLRPLSPEPDRSGVPLQPGGSTTVVFARTRNSGEPMQPIASKGGAVWLQSGVVSRDEHLGRGDIGTGPLGVIGNIIWLVLAGWWLALGHLLVAIVLAVTITAFPSHGPT